MPASVPSRSTKLVVRISLTITLVPIIAMGS